jgi:hypothetical protein
MDITQLTATTWTSTDWRYVIEYLPACSSLLECHDDRYAITDQGRRVGTFSSLESAAAWLVRFDAGQERAQS